MDDIKAPPMLWALGAALTLIGFYQLSSGLGTLLDLARLTPLSFAKAAAGIYLVISGIALSFLTKTGKIMVISASGLGIVLSLFRQDWIRFLVGMDNLSYESKASPEQLIVGVAVCLAVGSYIMISPAVAGAFASRKRKGYTPKKIFEK